MVGGMKAHRLDVPFFNSKKNQKKIMEMELLRKNGISYNIRQ